VGGEKRTCNGSGLILEEEANSDQSSDACGRLSASSSSHMEGRFLPGAAREGRMKPQ